MRDFLVERKEVWLWAVIGVAIFFSFTTPAVAGENKTLQLDEIVVSATKTEESVKDIPAGVSVIQGTDLEHSGARNVTDALHLVPGIQLMDVEGNGSQVMMTMRGMPHTNSQYIAVLVDGIPCNDTEDKVSWAGIPMSNVERIEVIKGPASALYGMNAMGGVINIITKKPAAETEAVIGAGYGSYNENKVSASLSDTHGKLGYYIDAEREASDGWRDENSDYERCSAHGKVDIDLTQNANLVLNVAFSSWENEWPDYLPVDYYHQDTGQVYFKHGNEKYEQPVGSAVYEHQLTDGIKLSNKFYVQHTEKEWRNIVDFVDMDSDANMIGDDLQLHIDHLLLNRENTVIVGGSYRYDDLDLVRRYSTYSGLPNREYKNTTTQRAVAAFFIQDEWHLTDQITTFMGFRYDSVDFDYEDKLKPQNSGNDVMQAWSPKFGVIYQPLSTFSVYANMGTAFKPPSASQVATWQDLDPEQAVSYEVGAKGSLADRLVYTLAYYHTTLKDQLTYVADSSQDLGYRLTNAGESIMYGFEAEVTFYLLDNLALFASYNYNVSEFDDLVDDKTGVDYSGNELMLQPRNKVSGGIYYRHPLGITAMLTTKWVDKQYLSNLNEYQIDAYTTTDLKLTYSIGIAELSLSVRNLFDEDYASYGDNWGGGDIYLTPGDPLTLFGQVTLKF